jgi:SAM-dependent methyltransferase
MNSASTRLFGERALREAILAGLHPKRKSDSIWDDQALKVYFSEKDLWRMSVSAALIPKPHSASDHLVDIGGTVFWLPLYLDLGYRHITMLVRQGGGFFHDFDLLRQEEFKLEIVEADAELDPYPIKSENAQCVICFELLEHFAGDPMHFMAESNRILGTGGVMCLTTPNVLWYQNLVNLFIGDHPFSWSVFTDSYGDRHNREYTPFELRELFEAGGFTVEYLKTLTCQRKSWRRRGLGYLLSFPGALARRVSFALRGELSLVRAHKLGSVKDRYPEFLYNLYGKSMVSYKVKKRGNL